MNSDNTHAAAATPAGRKAPLWQLWQSWKLQLALVLTALAFRALYLWELSTLPAWDRARGDEAYFLRTAAALRSSSTRATWRWRRWPAHS